MSFSRTSVDKSVSKTEINILISAAFSAHFQLSAPFVLFFFFFCCFFSETFFSSAVSILRGGVSSCLSYALSFQIKVGNRLRKPCGIRSSTISASPTFRYRSAVSLYGRSPRVAAAETRLPYVSRTAIRSLPYCKNKQPRGFPRSRAWSF